MPTLRERWKLITKAAVGTFDTSAASAAFGMLSGTQLGGEAPVRGSRDLLDHYSTMPWLRAVSARIGDAVAATDWRLFTTRRPNERRAFRDVQLQRAGLDHRKALLNDRRESDSLVEVEDHIFLDALNRANSYHTGQSLRKIAQIHMDLVGETFLLKERNQLGAPVAFWPVPPHWIEETPSVDNPRFRVSFRAWQGDIPDTEILWMADPNPTNPFGRGSGLAKTLGDELETDEFASKFTKEVFINRAKPDFIVWPEVGETSDTQRQQLRAEWLTQHQGFWRQFRPMFANKKIGIHEFKHDFKALQLTELREHERNTIIQVFGFPPEILGVIENSNRSTIDAAGFLFDLYVLTPRLEFLRTQLQEKIIPEYDDRLVLDYVSPVKEDRVLQQEVMKAHPYAFLVDEIRARGGCDPLKEDLGQLHAVPPGMTFHQDLEGAEGQSFSEVGSSVASMKPIGRGSQS